MSATRSGSFRWITHDWEAKLICLVLAFLLWYVVKDQIARSKPKPEMPEGWPVITLPRPENPASMRPLGP